MTPAQFYSGYDANDPWGNYRPYLGTNHRGSDVGQPYGTPIPSFVSGRVVRSEYQSALGNVVVVQSDAGFYVGWAHLIRKGLPVGTQVSFGTTVGEIGNTGSQSFGPHTHITGSWTDDTPWSGPTFDIWPTINNAVYGATAGGIITPIEEDDMTPEQQKTLDEIHWMLKERVRPQLDDLADPVGKGSVHKKLDQLLWVTNDGTSGIRAMLAKVLKKLGI